MKHFFIGLLFLSILDRIKSNKTYSSQIIKAFAKFNQFLTDLF